MKTIVAILLILHGLAHAVLAMVPSPKAPDQGFATFFSGIGSWVLPGLSKPASRTIASLLAGLAAIGFIAAGLALLGALVPFGWWRVLSIVSALPSLLLVCLYWDRTLIVGPLIDVVILAVLLLTNWSSGQAPLNAP